MGVIGGGLLVAVAAALWLAYLMPIWIRRRQYVATERNAVRLQQTLRILAETAETPEPVIIEATARQVAAHQRVLHEQERAARLNEQASERLAIAERRAAQAAADAAAEVVASIAVPTEPISVVDAAAAERRTGSVASAAISPRMLRRRRALCSLLLLAGLVTAVVGSVMLAFAAVATAVTVVIVGVAICVAAFVALSVLARARVTRPVVRAAAPRVSEPFEPVELVESDAAPEGWTPQPLPRPLTLSRGTIAATAMASIEAAAELQRLALEAERAKRIEELATPMPTIAPAASKPEPVDAEPVVEEVSPYAGMGVVGSPQRRFDDLDAVLRRRRQAS
ncbi:hypothetical protein [Agromyces sp. Marseille-Q5079]|uniref:hypothetical protein n=1 Tax=Agromyces sp. Marseille-Q5079 TaxID=3439059 RepID=UPI003D9C9E2D